MIPTSAFKLESSADGSGFVYGRSAYGFELLYGAFGTCKVKSLKSFRYRSDKSFSCFPYIKIKDERMELPSCGEYDVWQTYTFPLPYTGVLIVGSHDFCLAGFADFDGVAD